MWIGQVAAQKYMDKELDINNICPNNSQECENDGRTQVHLPC